jgi:hypothetical protein
VKKPAFSGGNRSGVTRERIQQMTFFEGGSEMAGTRASGGRNARTLPEHRLRGTVRPSRHAGLRDPIEAPAGPVVKPAQLSTAASAIWDVLAPICQTLGTLTPADVWAFVTILELEATRQKASTDKSTATSIGESAYALRLERQTASALRPWLETFGLTPGSRARLQVARPKGTDPFDAFQQQRSKWAGLL